MAAPTITAVAVDTSGMALSLTFNATVSHAAGAVSLAIAARLATIAATYGAGDGTQTLVYTLASAVYQGEVPTVTAATDAAEAGATPNAAVSGVACTNNSTGTLPVPGPLGPASGMMRNRCMVLRKTEGQSATSAGKTVTWAPIYTNVPCSIQGHETNEDTSEGAETSHYTWFGFFPRACDLRAIDRLCAFAGGVQGLSGRILEVKGNPVDDAGLGAYRRVRLEEVKGNGA